MNTAKIRKTIKSLTEGHRDPVTGEINHTALAEETAQVLDYYEGDNYTIPEIIFELALEAS